MSAAPEWLQVVGILAWSTAMTVGVFWQPRWMHRLMAWLVTQTEQLIMRVHAALRH